MPIWENYDGKVAPDAAPLAAPYGQRVTTRLPAGKARSSGCGPPACRQAGSVTDTLAMALAGLYDLLCEVKPEQWEGLRDAMRQAGVQPMDLPGLWSERADAVRNALHRMAPGRLIDLALAIARKIERHACE